MHSLTMVDKATIIKNLLQTLASFLLSHNPSILQLGIEMKVKHSSLE